MEKNENAALKKVKAYILFTDRSLGDCPSAIPWNTGFVKAKIDPV